MDAGALDADENTEVEARPVRIRAVAVHTSGYKNLCVFFLFSILSREAKKLVLKHSYVGLNSRFQCYWIRIWIPESQVNSDPCRFRQKKTSLLFKYSDTLDDRIIRETKK
jgi:hypothetical protein